MQRWYEGRAPRAKPRLSPLTLPLLSQQPSASPVPDPAGELPRITNCSSQGPDPPLWTQLPGPVTERNAGANTVAPLGSGPEQSAKITLRSSTCRFTSHLHTELFGGSRHAPPPPRRPGSDPLSVPSFAYASLVSPRSRLGLAPQVCPPMNPSPAPQQQ